jgi:hypothetical protein
MRSFFATPPEQKRITALETHNAAMTGSQLHQHRIGAWLRDGVMTTTLANEMTLTGLGNQIKNLSRNQGVVNEGITVAEKAMGLHREQIGITRACTDEINGSGEFSSRHGRAASRSIRP